MTKRLAIVCDAATGALTVTQGNRDLDWGYNPRTDKPEEIAHKNILLLTRVCNMLLANQYTLQEYVGLARRRRWWWPWRS